MSLTLNMLWNQFLPSKPDWSIDQIPDLTGKVSRHLTFRPLLAPSDFLLHAHSFLRCSFTASSQVAAVTGGYGGVGFETVKVCLALYLWSSETSGTKLELNNLNLSFPPSHPGSPQEECSRLHPQSINCKGRRCSLQAQGRRRNGRLHRSRFGGSRLSQKGSGRARFVRLFPSSRSICRD